MHTHTLLKYNIHYNTAVPGYTLQYNDNNHYSLTLGVKLVCTRCFVGRRQQHLCSRGRLRGNVKENEVHEHWKQGQSTGHSANQTIHYRCYLASGDHE